MTSIEWLWEQIPFEFTFKRSAFEIFEQAKEMHKQEMASNCSQHAQQEISDEEIEKANYTFKENDTYFIADKESFMAGARWYREQLKQRVK